MGRADPDSLSATHESLMIMTTQIAKKCDFYTNWFHLKWHFLGKQYIGRKGVV